MAIDSFKEIRSKGVGIPNIFPDNLTPLLPDASATVVNLLCLNSIEIVVTQVATPVARWMRPARSTVYKILRQKGNSQSQKHQGWLHSSALSALTASKLFYRPDR